MRIFRQLVKEFWIPFFAAIAWTLINFYTRKSPDWSLTKSINIFGASFFLASWLTSQYFRVRKQSHVEDNLEKIQIGIKSLLQELEVKTKDLIGQVTGGDSFCHLMLSHMPPENDSGVLMAIHEGKYPLYDVSARIVDLDVFERVMETLAYRKIKEADTHTTFVTLIPGHCIDTGEIWHFAGGKAIRRFNIFFITRNGSFTQILRFQKIGGRWLSATKVERATTPLGHAEVIFEQVQPGFPKSEKGEIDWN
jgi:hypothetical protein